MMERNTAFRYALSMNNIATSLLRRRLYRDALQVFSDAIFCVRQQQVGDSIQNQCNNNQQTQENMNNDFKLKIMYQHAENLVFSEDCPFTCHLEIELSNPIYARDLQCFDNIEHLFYSQISSVPNIFPILIDDANFSSDDVAENDMDFEFCILFYNCAIAHYCLWQSESDIVDQLPIHFNAAVQLLIMAHEHCSETLFYLESKETQLASKLMHVNAITLMTLLLILRQRSLSSSLTRSSHDEKDSAIRMFQSFLEKLVSTAKMTAYQSYLLFGNIVVKTAGAA
jgi:hypothetical protein